MLSVMGAIKCLLVRTTGPILPAPALGGQFASGSHDGLIFDS